MPDHERHERHDRAGDRQQQGGYKAEAPQIEQCPEHEHADEGADESADHSSQDSSAVGLHQLADAHASHRAYDENQSERVERDVSAQISESQMLLLPLLRSACYCFGSWQRCPVPPRHGTGGRQASRRHLARTNSTPYARAPSVGTRRVGRYTTQPDMPGQTCTPHSDISPRSHRDRTATHRSAVRLGTASMGPNAGGEGSRSVLPACTCAGQHA
jgi:hypothetical protein